MRTLVKSVALVAALALPASLSGQWPAYPDQNVPRTPDGKIDMSAPTPKAFDGKPDLSGVWKNVGRGPGQPRETLGPNDIPFGTFFDIGQGFKDGLPLQPWAKELEAKRMADNGKDNPDAWCLPMGNQQFNVHPFCVSGGAGLRRHLMLTRDPANASYRPSSAVTIVVPSGENCAAFTMPACGRTASCSPVAVRQIRAVPSRLPVISRLSSGEKATQVRPSFAAVYRHYNGPPMPRR